MERSKDDGIGCLMMNARFNKQGSWLYFWGFGKGEKKSTVFVLDKDKFALSGDYISIVIDGIDIGKYKVAKTQTTSIYKGVTAYLPADRMDDLEHLFSIGANIKLITGSATYSSSLNGSNVAMGYFDDCEKEAKVANSVAGGIQQPNANHTEDK